MYEDINYSVDRGIATVEIDRPAVKNAFRAVTIGELNDALRRTASDETVYALVVTGADDAFCAGADVSDMPDWSDQSKEDYAGFLWSVQNVVRQIRRMGKPSVAAVSGPAIGAGCDFALACDVRVVGPDAVFREGFVRVGLVPGDGGAWLLPQLIGRSQAAEYLLTGKDMTAAGALDTGLAMEKSPNPLEAARSFAEEVRDLPATAVRHTKRLMDPDLSFEEYCERAIDYQWDCVNDREHDEAIRAFAEQREPDYDREY